MRFILFYSNPESFNYFTDEITKELTNRGHEVFILDTRREGREENSFNAMSNFLTEKADAVICFDGLGIHEDFLLELWENMDACIINIFMDPPLRFHHFLRNDYKKYIQFCPDLFHIEYIKRNFKNIKNVEFMPHYGTEPEEEIIPYEKRKYDILFSGTYYKPEVYINNLNNLFKGNEILINLYNVVFDYIMKNPHSTIEGTLDIILEQSGLGLSHDGYKSLMAGYMDLDWLLRTIWREITITQLAGSGLEIYLLGRGWENHPSCGCPNMHIISDRVKFADTFEHIGNAKINLNVMPWFKAGTHDRIFNTMLRKSVCLTDSSLWIDENFTNNENIVLYSLKEIQKLPEIAAKILRDPAKAESIAERGYEKAKNNFVWKNCIDKLTESLERNYGIK